ncbi:MAG TPA: hypothetical protein VER11_34150 [Polyangiaceae bacterium]|nr:hypothetical protein [Polyangiaceae bacterium]
MRASRFVETAGKPQAFQLRTLSGSGVSARAMGTAKGALARAQGTAKQAVANARTEKNRRTWDAGIPGGRFVP